MNGVGVATASPSAGVSDHGLLEATSLTDDDHLQYLLLAGRAGGQSAFGGLAAADNLTLAASPVPGTGRIILNSPLVFGPYQPTGALYGFSYTATEAFTAAFIGGGLNFSGTISFLGGTFIYESYRGAPTITTLGNPGFAAYTVLQALPAFVSGSGAGHNPLSPLILNAGPNVSHSFSGTRTVGNIAAINFAGTIRALVSGAVLNVTNWTFGTFAPKFSTVAGATTNFGTMRGLWCQSPSVAPFGAPQAGTELMTSYSGVYFENMTFGGASAEYNVIRSLLNTGTNKRFLNHTGTAPSRMRGQLNFDLDNLGISYGLAADVVTNWNGGAYEWDPVLGPDMRWTPSASGYWTLLGSAALQGFGINLDTIVFGTTAPDPSSANYFVQFAGANLRAPTVGGEYADVLWTAGGSIAVSGFAISNLDAFKINALGYTLGGGTVSDVSTLHVAAMSSDGIATRSHALRVQGRTRIDGHMNHNADTSIAQLTANVTQLTLAANNNMRHIYLVDADASGPWTIRGILNAQTGDSIYIINDGANAYLLGHQDGTAAAIDRIISPTGAALTLAADEMAKLWYDSSVSRWRILETTGA